MKRPETCKSLTCLCPTDRLESQGGDASPTPDSARGPHRRHFLGSSMSGDSELGQPASSRMLIVADHADEMLGQFMDACRSAGWLVDHVEDVYRAMARLADSACGPYDRVIVDVRTLDDNERAFLDLAPRYFSGIRISELTEFVQGNGATRKSSRLDEVGLHTETIVPEARGPNEMVFEAETHTAEVHSAATEDGIPNGLDPAFAEDGAAPVIAGRIGPDQPAAPAPEPREPSLHEMVRMRMMPDAPFGSRRVQRVPPG